MATEIGVIIGLFFLVWFFFLPKLAVTINVHREEVRLCISGSLYNICSQLLSNFVDAMIRQSTKDQYRPLVQYKVMKVKQNFPCNFTRTFVKKKIINKKTSNNNNCFNIFCGSYNIFFC